MREVRIEHPVNYEWGIFVRRIFRSDNHTTKQIRTILVRPDQYSFWKRNELKCHVHVQIRLTHLADCFPVRDIPCLVSLRMFVTVELAVIRSMRDLRVQKGGFRNASSVFRHLHCHTMQQDSTVCLFPA